MASSKETTQMTPSKKRTYSDTITCSIMNVSDVLLSPPKAGSKKKTPTQYCQFGIVNESKKKVCRSVSYETSHVDFFRSEDMKKVVDNDKMAIEINGVEIGQDGGIQLNTDSSFGSVVELKKPYNVQYPDLKSIFEIKFKVTLNTEVSVEGKVLTMKEEYSPLQKKKVFVYCVADSTNKMNITSFTRLNVDIEKSYVFRNVVCDTYQNERMLKYQVTSSFVASKKQFKPKVKEEIARKTITVTNLKQNKVEESIHTCSSCQEPVSIDEDRYYECACGSCGTMKESTNDVSYALSASLESGEEMLLQLSHKVFKECALSKKDVVTNKWDIQINTMNEIQSMSKKQ